MDLLHRLRYPARMTPDRDIDTSGLLCPWPVLKAAKALRDMETGGVLRLTATDPVAVIDVPHFCAEGGHELLSTDKDGDAVRFLIRKNA